MFSLNRHNQPIPLEESMTAEAVEAKLKAKLQDGFTVSKKSLLEYFGFMKNN